MKEPNFIGSFKRKQKYYFSANLRFCFKCLISDYPIIFGFAFVGVFVLFFSS